MASGSIQTDFGDPFRSPTKKERSEVDGACFSMSTKRESLLSSVKDEVYLMPLERVRKEYVYNTDKGQRGLVYILNHSKFNTRAKKDDNSNIMAKIRKTWEELEFNVIEHNDFSKTQIASLMKNVSSASYNYACFICIVKTQGKEDNLKANDGWYNAENLWKPFLDKDNCQWHGKPKIFILEAQRGTKVDKGIKLAQFQSEGPIDVPDSINYYADERREMKLYGIPLHADFLFVHSTFNGHVTYEDENGVPIFLNELCDVLKKHAKDIDFESMLTIVKYKLSRYKLDDTSEPYKQMPCTFSTLTKILYFRALDNFVLTDAKMDMIDSKQENNENEQQLHEHPTFTIEGTLAGFDARKLNINVSVS